MPVLSSNFTELFQSYWAPDHIAADGDLTNLTLDTSSGNIVYTYKAISLSLSHPNTRSWVIYMTMNVTTTNN